MYPPWHRNLYKRATCAWSRPCGPGAHNNGFGATDLLWIVEVPPIAGTLIAFRRSDNSWHGHDAFDGERRVIQFNWLTSEGNRQIAMLRHHASAAFIKRRRIDLRSAPKCNAARDPRQGGHGSLAQRIAKKGRRRRWKTPRV